MNAVVASKPSTQLLLVGKEFRRDLTITFELTANPVHRFAVALYPKGKGPYFHRSHVAFGCAEKLEFSWNTLHVDGALFKVTAKERNRIEAWLESLPAVKP